MNHNYIIFPTATGKKIVKASEVKSIDINKNELLISVMNDENIYICSEGELTFCKDIFDAISQPIQEAKPKELKGIEDIEIIRKLEESEVFSINLIITKAHNFYQYCEHVFDLSTGGKLIVSDLTEDQKYHLLNRLFVYMVDTKMSLKWLNNWDKELEEITSDFFDSKNQEVLIFKKQN